MSSGSALIGFTLRRLSACATIRTPLLGVDIVRLAALLVTAGVITMWLWFCGQCSASCTLFLLLAAYRLWEEGYLPVWQPAPALPLPPPTTTKARTCEGNSAHASEVRRALLQFRRESAVPLVDIQAKRPRSPRLPASTCTAPAHRTRAKRVRDRCADSSTFRLQADTAPRAAAARSVHVQPCFGVQLLCIPPSFSDSACKATLSNVRASAQPFIYRH
ncbi:ABL067Cp [Eremothecium gossypii ATCC 10895]|uniref:ABL067Cp n=1 Tax=Eremothecium gossypii (strain ATCC 10895 / CBS 109.51 / FGSC 9923 / NRRL Y-1056) TaxID=284811 RepID=Q75DU0_EREGS|nr:ABL067Cp [Eremothecium gossypii ATCC 10895]AAS50704.2 ABL067Cp [Eremothecium gossypii ATCC 10895]AEY94992.1 FABL067Cp [Eremothecium gossypii FDAG1]